MPEEKEIYDTIIIGGGCAGLSCAVYAARFNLKTLIITKERGGLVTTTHLVENWPGEKAISGLDLAKKLEEHVKTLNVEIKDETVEDIEKKKENNKNIFEIKTNKTTFKAKTVVFATGSHRRELKVPGAKEFYAKGVSYCATCDAAFYKDKIVGMVGGSDAAVKEGLYLTEFAKKVYIIYRKEYPRAEPINMKRFEEKVKEGKIELINNTNVVEVKGNEFVNKIVLDKEYKGSKEFPLDGLFIEIGQIPNTELAKKLGIELNEKNEIKIDRFSKTNIEGIYGAGDCCDAPFKQAITGASEGVVAAFSAFKFVKEKFG